MPIVTIRHTTIYRYAKPVAFGDHRLMFRPRDSHDLRLLQTGARDQPAAPDPLAARRLRQLDRRRQLRRAGDRAAPRQHHPARALSRRRPRVPHRGLCAATTRSATRRRRCPTSGAPSSATTPTRSTRWTSWARRLVATPGETDTQALLVDMTAAIRQELPLRGPRRRGRRRRPRRRSQRGAGTCRDFALFMMEAARSLGFAARFVSGYLLRRPGGRRRCHACLGADLPAGCGWVEFDPTNALVGGHEARPRGRGARPEPGHPRLGHLLRSPGRLHRHDGGGRRRGRVTRPAEVG